MTSDTRGIDEVVDAVSVLDSGVDSVSCSACDVGNDNSLLAAHTVDDRGLARVGLTDNGNVDHSLVELLILGEYALLDNRVEKVARTRAVKGRDSDGLAIKSELVELVELVGHLTYTVNLVYRDNDGLTRLFKHNGDVSVICDESRSDIAYKHDNVCGSDSYLRLSSHLLKNGIVALGLDTACINEEEVMAVPLGISVDSVSGNAGSVLNYCSALVDDFIKKCALTNVGSANDGYNRF